MTPPASPASIPAPVPEPEISVIVPTFNEIGNVALVIEHLQKALDGISWEVIFVDDDSPDGTAALVECFARKDHRVRCLKRVRRRGLSSACLDGMLLASAPFLAVMDGDLQHDEALLPKMVDILRRMGADIVIGSRYADGGGTGNWGRRRLGISRLATWLSRLALKTNIRDPMSGFFMIRRSALLACEEHASGIGAKILMELLASSKRPLRYRELPYRFRKRRTGNSKMGVRFAWGYLMLILKIASGRIFPGPSRGLSSPHHSDHHFRR